MLAFFRSGGGAPREDLVAAMADLGPALVEHYQLTSDHVRHLLAQIGAETGGMKINKESMNYSASRMVEVFGYRLRRYRAANPELRGLSILDVAKKLEGNADAIAEMSYGKRKGLGNYRTGDGAKFIGRGPTQITGRANYAAIRDEIRSQPGGATCPDLLEAPEALEVPSWAIRSAFADWSIKRMSSLVRGEPDDIKRVSSMLNAGSPNRWSVVNGKSARRRWYALARAQILSAPLTGSDNMPILRLGSEGEFVKDIQVALKGLGYNPGKADGIFGPLTRDAVLILQANASLAPTGMVDQATRKAITSGVPRNTGERQDVADKDVETPITQQAKKASTNAKAAGVGAALIWVSDQIPDVSPISERLSSVKPAVDLITQNTWALYLVGGGLVAFFAYRSVRAIRSALRETYDAYRDGSYLG